MIHIKGTPEPVIRKNSFLMYVDDRECYAGPHGQCLLKPDCKPAIEYVAEVLLQRKLSPMERVVPADGNTWNLAYDNLLLLTRGLGEGPTAFRRRCLRASGRL